MRFRSVVLVLCAIGAVAGAIAGMLFAVAQGVFTGGLNALALFLLLVAAILGAALGACIGPPIALALLRRVPLWRAALETALGASAGFALSLVLETSPLLFGLGGATLAAIRLRNAYPHDESLAPVRQDAGAEGSPEESG